MTTPVQPEFISTDLDQIANMTGHLVIFANSDGTLNPCAKRVNRLTKGQIKKFVESKAFDKMKTGDAHSLSGCLGIQADTVIVTKMSKKSAPLVSRTAGAKVAKLAGFGADLQFVLGNVPNAQDFVFGAVLRRYDFTKHKTKAPTTPGAMTCMVNKEDAVAQAYAALSAVAEGVFFTRDLTNEPANILDTTEFAERLIALQELGVQVKVLEEADMEKLGMGSLLSVGNGSDCPSKLVVMEWNGGGAENPFALVGKGVVFDTGGISLKPAGGMEDMTMDMGGAGVVSGVMKALATRKAKANVVGLVGLVENMPDARATRPGDVVTSMKGDTIEVINTDAEGRLVLADVLWYAQETYEPTGIIDLATLTGAIIIGLGHENAGVFSNDDKLADMFLTAAKAEEEGAWRMPLGTAYDKMLESRIADMKNVGGRAAGSVTAAQFLQRFVKSETPWIHLDIAGVASVKSETSFAPKGATGWGVKALNRFIADHFER